ncbi:ABC transporter permease [Maribius pontilimi]|uniref:Transport permease protein n=1 Tax=Palleronia pontilimi TaxID=1964209 RepID=A0A934IH95_9RHOB|nr:ABC transporter permease [Palleronia pontilimi]MBJ3764347.1 ABC transporter permease [Palleronia pontilimi]
MSEITDPRHRGAKLKRVNRSFAAPRSIIALILREMSSRYGRSPGGYIWAILEPLGAILVLSVGFSLLLRAPSLGNSFLLFYASGFLPFQLYLSISNAAARCITFSKSLLFYPAVTWIDALLARVILNTLTGMLVSYILLTAIFIATDTGTALSIGPIAQALGLGVLVGIGVGALNCAIMGLFSPWEQIWSIITRPLFIASGVIFLYEDLPPLAQSILWWNPLMHITGLMRRGIYSTYNATYVSIPYVTLVSMICLALGLMLVRRHYRTILNN